MTIFKYEVVATDKNVMIMEAFECIMGDKHPLQFNSKYISFLERSRWRWENGGDIIFKEVVSGVLDLIYKHCVENANISDLHVRNVCCVHILNSVSRNLKYCFYTGGPEGFHAIKEVQAEYCERLLQKLLDEMLAN